AAAEVAVVIVFYEIPTGSDAKPLIYTAFDIINLKKIHIPFAFQIDALSSLFMLIITGVGFLIHVYSSAYMKGDEGLVMGDNFLIMFIGWEGVGLCSFLLIGFWFKNIDYVSAAKKAFIMNRIGDVVSQLGLMFASLGVGGYVAAVFHVMTHAFFKALLFLGAGSVIHGMHHEQDVNKMGGLKKYMPITYWTFLIGCLAISAIPPLSGFFSKDMILFNLLSHNKLAYVFGIIISLLTAFYMARLFALTFLGDLRTNNLNPHESPKLITIPLIILAILSIVGGFVGIPALFSSNADKITPLLSSVIPALKNNSHVSHTIEWVSIIGITVAIIAWIANFFKKYIEKAGLNQFIENVGYGAYQLGDRFTAIQTGNVAIYVLFMVLSILLTIVLHYSLNNIGSEGAYFQAFSHGLVVLGLWLSIDYAERKYNANDINSLSGLATLNPMLSILIVLFGLANIAMPLTSSFIGILLLGITFLYGSSGSFMLDKIGLIAVKGFDNICFYGWILIIISFCFKISVAPFHFWAPDVYDGTPTVFTSFMSTIVKGGAFLGFVQILWEFPWSHPLSANYRLIIIFIILLTLIIGNFSALYQSNVKRMLAYSSIVQAGFMMFITLQHTELSKEALLFYIFTYSLSGITLFYALTVVKGNKYKDFRDLSKTNPFLAIIMTISLISLSGIPLSAGFFAKFFALSNAMTNPQNISIIVIALVLAVLSVYYYFRLIIAMYFKEGNL
ncbi:unnamed protein product, partial [Darwinula stevensoni]